MSDPIAYVADADTFCGTCTIELYGSLDGVDNEGNEIGAIAPWDEIDRASGLFCGKCHGEIVAAEPFTVIENTPGYLPEDDDPATFPDFRSAVRYMIERMREYRDECIVDVGGWLDRTAGEGYLVDEGRPHDLGRYFSVIDTPHL